jgi:FkbM family methyltransferase
MPHWAYLTRDVTTTQRVISVGRNGKRFAVEIQRGPKGLKDTLQYYSQRLLNPSQRRLYRFYNRALPRSWNDFSTGAFEPDTFDVFDAFLDGEHTYIDVGAWIGPTALYGCQLAKHCYAIEPDPVAYKLLEVNFRLNPALLQKTTLFRGCIGDTCGVARLGNIWSAVGGDSRSSLLGAGARVEWKVQSTTLQRFMKEHGVENCNFIKMDVEGGETVILPSIATFLAAEKPTLHLSLHPFLYHNPYEEMNTILEVLSPYPHILDKRARPIDPGSLLRDGGFQSCDCIVATARLPRR